MLMRLRLSVVGPGNIVLFASSTLLKCKPRSAFNGVCAILSCDSCEVYFEDSASSHGVGLEISPDGGNVPWPW